MALIPSQRLGPYEILAAIGAGGMGEVYRARDTRLDRIVAIKVLPAHLADKPELRERFEREARTIASLNHPHICTLHDIGRQDGIDYLVMEYLEGETLAQRLLKGPLPLDQVLQYAIEISDALDKAHRKGVTHRDLKPGNIMLTKSGTKLLDFGLAKLKQDASAAATTPFSQLPTAANAVTAQGTILGTLQYMAPEQVEGGEVDARTDIFAFGAVVYEMATAKKAFEGKSQASVIARILDSDPPPISSLQPMTPPALGRLVKRCVAKNPDQRWQSAGDLTHELKWIDEEGSQAAGPAPVVPGRKSLLSSLHLAWSAAAVAIFAGLAVATFTFLRSTPQDRQAVRFLVSPPDGWNLTREFGFTGAATASTPLAVSPDGHRLAFVATSADGQTLLWVRPLDTVVAQSLGGTSGASLPFWSPDSRSLAFFADGKLKKIDLTGGPAITLCDAPRGYGGTWSRDGVVVFAQAGSLALQRVSAAGGAPTVASKLGEGETGHRRPFFLPDGRHFLYYAIGASARRGGIYSVYVGSLDSAERTLLLNADSQVVYSQGHLVFLRETTLMAQPFDAQGLKLSGEAFPIAEAIQTQAYPPVGVFSASESGVLAYQTGTIGVGSRLVWFDRTGQQRGVLGDSAPYDGLEFSPDGKRASVSIREAQGRVIWIYDLERGLRTRFTFDSADENTPVWSPDGSRIVFSSRRKGHMDLYQKASNGAATEDALFADTDSLGKTAQSWSPDGKFIMYDRVDAQTGYDLFVLPLFGDHKPYPFLQTQFNERRGRFSPDGRWVAYASDESGRYEVYVSPFPGPGGKWQVSTAGGMSPRWRHDGNELYYLAFDNTLMAAAVNGRGASFGVGAVKPLFRARTAGASYLYDVSADGLRFLVNTLPEQTASAPITVVLNWSAGLKK